MIRYLTVLFLLVPVLASAEWAHRSPDAITYGFDFFERFDDLQDWSPPANHYSGEVVDQISSADHPRRTNGDYTLLNVWQMYSEGQTPAHPIIYDHSSYSGGHIWGNSGKAVAIGLGNLTTDNSARGINRFGVTLSETGTNGDETGLDGYDEFYVFFMMYKPRQWYPTAIDGSGVGSFVQEDYDSQGYVAADTIEKFLVLGHGLSSPWTTYNESHHGYTANYPISAYSFVNVITYMPIMHNHNRFLPEFHLGPSHNLAQDGSDSNYPCFNEAPTGKTDADRIYSGVFIPVDEWVGIEMRYKVNTAGNLDAERTAWWYESDGTKHLIDSSYHQSYMSSCDLNDGQKLNRIYIGGNNSNTYKWGPGMWNAYYVDDLIIDDQPIGDKYFSEVIGDVPSIFSHGSSPAIY